jgi:putative membrane protein
MIGHFIKGMFIGLANIIPGVSGGTMALILGLYDRIIRAISALGPQFPKDLLHSFKSGTDPLPKRLMALALKYDLVFLGVMSTGAIFAIVATSKLMVFLLYHQHDPTYGFFFGLIAASIVIPWSMMKKRGATELVVGIAAVILTIAISNAQSPQEKVDAIQKKMSMKAATTQTLNESYTPDHSASKLGFFFLAGAIAISAMILPGISGSFLMILLGVYFDILAALSSLDLPVIAVFAAGCAVGILAFVRLLNFLLERFYSETLAFLTGLMIGSLWTVWPFKAMTMVGERPVYLNNVIPEGVGSNVFTTMLAAAIGGTLVIIFHMMDQKKNKAES